MSGNPVRTITSKTIFHNCLKTRCWALHGWRHSKCCVIWRYMIWLNIELLFSLYGQILPSVLWRRWLGSRKGFWYVKKILSGEVLAWLSVWSEVQMICIWSSWCHCHPIISCSRKIQNGLHFWCWLTQVVLEKKPLNGCSSSSGSLYGLNMQEWWVSGLTLH